MKKMLRTHPEFIPDIGGVAPGAVESLVSPDATKMLGDFFGKKKK